MLAFCILAMSKFSGVVGYRMVGSWEALRLQVNLDLNSSSASWKLCGCGRIPKARCLIHEWKVITLTSWHCRDVVHSVMRMEVIAQGQAGRMVSGGDVRKDVRISVFLIIHLFEKLQKMA